MCSIFEHVIEVTTGDDIHTDVMYPAGMHRRPRPSLDTVRAARSTSVLLRVNEITASCCGRADDWPLPLLPGSKRVYLHFYSHSEPGVGKMNIMSNENVLFFNSSVFYTRSLLFTNYQFFRRRRSWRCDVLCIILQWRSSLIFFLFFFFGQLSVFTPFRPERTTIIPVNSASDI